MVVALSAFRRRVEGTLEKVLVCDKSKFPAKGVWTETARLVMLSLVFSGYLVP